MTHTTHECAICGTAIEQTAGRGRPKIFCTTNCRDTFNALTTFREKLANVKFASKGEVQSMRSELFMVANTECTNDLIADDAS
jgi:predicted nucleic acid-binding Zn ribbon protein